MVLLHNALLHAAFCYANLLHFVELLCNVALLHNKLLRCSSVITGEYMWLRVCFYRNHKEKPANLLCPPQWSTAWDARLLLCALIVELQPLVDLLLPDALLRQPPVEWRSHYLATVIQHCWRRELSGMQAEELTSGTGLWSCVAGSGLAWCCSFACRSHDTRPPASSALPQADSCCPLSRLFSTSASHSSPWS